MKNFYREHRRVIKDGLIVILSALFIASLVWFVTSFNESYKAGELQPEYHPRKELAEQKAAPTVTIDTIKPWMTFNYLNVVFKLPPSYLKNALAVIDPHYPNVRIDSYAKEMHTDQAFFLQNVKKALTSYSYTQ